MDHVTHLMISHEKRLIDLNLFLMQPELTQVLLIPSSRQSLTQTVQHYLIILYLDEVAKVLCHHLILLPDLWRVVLEEFKKSTKKLNIF